MPQQYSNPNQRQNQPYFIDLENGECLFLQTVPLEMEMENDTTWVTIAAPGRNNPLYQYTGAEDTLNFTITWYADEANKEDVLKKCKWIEALGKNDGYDNKPHRVKFIFGELFKATTWIVFNARYKFSMFDRSKGMMPCLANQEIVLKRVSVANRSRSEILNLNT